MSQLVVIDDLAFPNAQEPNYISTLTFSIPANCSSFTFHCWYDPKTHPGGTSTIANLKLVGPNNMKVPNSTPAALPFLYTDTSSMKITSSGLSQGYASILVPVDSSQVPNMTGNWTAKLTLLDPTIVQGSAFTVRICQRLKDAGEPAVPNYTYGLEAKVFYVGNNNRQKISGLLTGAMSYMNTSIFNQAGITVRYDNVNFLPGGVYTSDVYSASTASLIANNADPSKINIFLIEDFQISIPGALGFAQLPGPMGFASPYTCVLVSSRPPTGMSLSEATLGLRIAHEMGHYLGLTHESACLSVPGCDKTTCTNILGDPSVNSNASKVIRGNLMNTSLPKPGLNDFQKYILQNAPLVSATAQVVKTRITSLDVTVTTGTGSFAWYSTDGAGTDDDVYFSLNGTGGMTQLLDTNWVNDFESGSTRTYKLSPGFMYKEDITGFDFLMVYGRTLMEIYMNDRWQLSAVTIAVNGLVVYSKSNINVWLSAFNDPQAQSRWGDTIHI
jgi:hypothetical protein